MIKVFYQCNADLFMKNGEQSFTKGKEYPFVCGEHEEVFVRDDDGHGHFLGEWEVHFTRIEREVFEAFGFEWFKHTPGYPMPCDGARLVVVLCGIDCQSSVLEMAENVNWTDEVNGMNVVIGWRYADGDLVEPEPKLEFPSPAENDEMICADMPLSAMDSGHLTESQRKHIDAMEEKQSAKERLQHDAETRALQERANSMQEAGRAMDRVNQDHTHKLGWMA